MWTKEKEHGSISKLNPGETVYDMIGETPLPEIYHVSNFLLLAAVSRLASQHILELQMPFLSLQ